VSLPVLLPYQAVPGERFGNTLQQSHEKDTLLSRPLVALDGEGKNDESGKHHYTHLQARWPKGKKALVKEHISTAESLQFLMSLPPKHTYVIFAGNYDANMWLQDLLYTPSYKELYDTGECDWHNYHLTWVENKYIRIRRGNYTRTIYDVFSWYQKSFVKACKEWSAGTSEQLEQIAAMKDRRGDFAHVDDAKIKEYCFEELDLLDDLTNKLRSAILRTDYRPRGLYGPGALAAAILEKERIKDYYGPYNADTALAAYYGGRFDSALFGWFEVVYQHDIRSAYPDQIRYLPCLRHANWQRSDNPATSRYGFYHVKWKVNPDTPYPPFPW
jgi:hypothetical protein